MALAPILICLGYVYIRDKYEKEPLKVLLLGVFYGALITFPIIQAETFMTQFLPISGLLFEAFYVSFFVASLVEETFKFAILYFLTWRNRNLNERFDGIVYGVFISLGFAMVENILYVFNPQLGGVNTALLRGVFSVPGHGFFGVTMGYYFALAKFEPESRLSHMLKAFYVTFIIHGLYDFILLSNMPYLMFIFVPFLAFVWYNGFIKMKTHINKSPFISLKEN